MECFAVADQLNAALEYILMDQDVLRGTKMKHKVIDGVLHFFVNYNFIVIKVGDPLDEMGRLDVSTGLKG